MDAADEAADNLINMYDVKYINKYISVLLLLESEKLRGEKKNIDFCVHMCVNPVFLGSCVGSACIFLVLWYQLVPSGLN